MGSSESSPRHPLPPPGCSRSATAPKWGPTAPCASGANRLMETTTAPILPICQTSRSSRSSGCCSTTACVLTQASSSQPASRIRRAEDGGACVLAAGAPRPRRPEGWDQGRPLRIPFGRNNGAANDAAANKKWDLEMVGFLRPTRVQAHFTYVEGCRAHLRSRYIALAVVRVS